jgi:hypothetical protein
VERRRRARLRAARRRRPAGLVAALGLGGDEPGEVAGDVAPAALVRELAYTLGLLPRPSGSSPADDARTPAAESAQRQALAQLLAARKLKGTALAHRPRIAVVDGLRGTLLALTDAAEIRSGAEVRPPPETPGYRPSAELDRFVRLRDRRCRFPGCRARARCGDLDHTDPYPHGPTAHDNLCCLCEHHHRLSHQAPGWMLRATDDGGLSWRMPNGEWVTTYPPRFGADDDLRPPGPASEGTDPPERAPEAVRPDEDPPPF